MGLDARPEMAEIAGRGSSADEYTVAMLAALNIASEFDRFRRQAISDLSDLDRDLASTSMVLEDALAKA